MKEFDLQKAKAGAPVCFRGYPARIICWDFKDKDYPIIALVDEDGVEKAYKFTNYGICSGEYSSYFALEMADVKHEGLVLIDPEGPHCIAHIYDTKEEAEEDAEREMIDYSAIAHIEWEE